METYNFGFVFSCLLLFISVLYVSTPATGSANFSALVSYICVLIMFVGWTLITIANSLLNMKDSVTTSQLAFIGVPMIGIMVTFGTVLGYVSSNSSAITKNQLQSSYRIMIGWFIIGTLIFTLYLTNSLIPTFSNSTNFLSITFSLHGTFLALVLSLSIALLSTLVEIFKNYRADGFQTIRSDGFNTYPHGR